jgi:hypothetical protein
VFVTELRVTVPDEIARQLAKEANEWRTSAEDVASEVLVHVRAANRCRPVFIGTAHSGSGDLSEQAEELLAGVPRP